VERAARQASLRQARVNLTDAERHDAAIRAARMFDAGDPGAQIVEDAFVHVRHVPPNGGRPSRTWGPSRRAPERTAGLPLGDNLIPLKRPAGVAVRTFSIR
jgi:hypothetical protein